MFDEFFANPNWVVAAATVVAAGITGGATIYGAIFAVKSVRKADPTPSMPHPLPQPDPEPVPLPAPNPDWPLHWLVPHPRNTEFTGREELMARLEDALAAGGSAAVTGVGAHVVHGMGGVGKSALALEFLHRNRERFRAVLWLGVETPESRAKSFADAARRLGLPQGAPDADATPDMVVQAVVDWLESHDDWLVVFDNAEAPEDLNGLIPTSGRGRAVVTTREADWPDLPHVPVDVWTRAESLDFLRDLGVEADRSALADALGDLPLALRQAAAVMRLRHIDAAAYLAELGKNPALLGKARAPDAAVAKVWEPSVERAGADCPDAPDLLTLIAFLAPDDVPLDVVKAHWPDRAVSDAADALARVSLAERDGDALALHRLVQRVARERLADADKARWAAEAMEMMNAALPNFAHDAIDVSLWPVYERLSPHARAAADHAEALGVAAAEAGRALNQIGFFLKDRGDYSGARPHYERALAIGEAKLGTDHPAVAIRLSNLGGVLQAEGDLSGARSHYERALTIGKAKLGTDHPRTAVYANNLGLVLHDEGDLPGARSHFERALAIGEATLGTDHPQTAIYAGNLGGVLQDEGDLPGARRHYERALAIGEAKLGTDHPQTAVYASNLGGVLQAEGDLPGARRHFERALAILEAKLPPDHPDIETARRNLASLDG